MARSEGCERLFPLLINISLSPWRASLVVGLLLSRSEEPQSPAWL